MMRKIKFTLLSMSMILCFNAIAQTEKEPLKAEFINNIVVDGDDADWESAISFFDEASGLMYSIANDDENLYVLIKATADAAMTKFTMGGVEVWISADGKEKRKTGIKYPVPLSWEERFSSRDRNATREDVRRQESERTYKTMELRGFENIKDNTYKVDELEIKVEYSGKNDNTIAEYKIPFATFCKSEQINGKNTFAVGIVLNGMQMPNFGGGGGGRPGGGRMSGDMQRQMREMSKGYSFWIYTQLTK
ncbi:MAG: hypothetical protein LBT56_01720 [Prevotellaceae bacterium]|jgi:hypothetical protein|nr:hypothetical protein [Prevotellaceae bacterium]